MTFRTSALLLLFGCLSLNAQAQPVIVYENVADSEHVDSILQVPTRGDGLEYVHDDGDGNTNQGPPSSFDPDMLWGNYFFTEEGGEVITHIHGAFGPNWPSLENNPAVFWILDDPDMDGDPRNATSLVSVEATPDVFNDNFFTVEIPPTHVSGAFFVGVSAKLLGGEDRPARVDTDGPADMAWFFYAPEISDVIDDLASAPYGTRMDGGDVIFPGVFMIRATAIPFVDSEPDPTPIAFSLLPNYPNPFSGETTIHFELPQSEYVTLSVFDLAGRLVTTLVDQTMNSGSHSVVWNAEDLSAGVYVYQMTAGAFTQSLRVTVVQ